MYKLVPAKSVVFFVACILFIVTVFSIGSCNKQSSPDNGSPAPGNPVADSANRRFLTKSAIVFTQLNPVVIITGTATGAVYGLDLNNDSVKDFYLKLTYDSVRCDTLIGNEYLLTISPAAGNEVASTDSLPNEMYGDETIGSSTLSWLDAPDQILAESLVLHSVNPPPVFQPSPPGNGRHGRGWDMSYNQKAVAGITVDNCSNILIGNWLGNQNQVQYLGVKLVSGGHVYYGWVAISLDLNSFAVYGYAFNKDPDNPIVPDQTY